MSTITFGPHWTMIGPGECTNHVDRIFRNFSPPPSLQTLLLNSCFKYCGHSPYSSFVHVVCTWPLYRVKSYQSLHKCSCFIHLAPINLVHFFQNCVMNVTFCFSTYLLHNCRKKGSYTNLNRLSS